MPDAPTSLSRTGKRQHHKEAKRSEEPGAEAASLAFRVLPVAVLVLVSMDRIRALYELGKTGELFCGIQIRRVIEVLASCGLYFISGPALILLNKIILRDLNFPYPITVANLGNISIALITSGLVFSGTVTLKRKSLTPLEYLRVVVPVAVFTTASLVLGNWAYLYLSVPLIQIMKSFTMVLVMIFGFFMGMEQPSFNLLTAVLFMVVGVCVSIGYDKDFRSAVAVAGGSFWLGIGIMLGANSAEAFRAVFTQLSVDRLVFFDALFWCSPMMVVLGLTMSLFLEGHRIMSAPTTSTLLAACLGSCLLGGIVTFSNFWLTKVVGSLTMKVLVNARNIGLVLFAVVAFGEPCSAMQYIGYSTSLVGLTLYNRARQLSDGEAARAKEQAPPREHDGEHAHLQTGKSPA